MPRPSIAVSDDPAARDAFGGARPALRWWRRSLTTIPAFAATSLLAAPAHAAVTWDGGNGDGDFSSAANWGGSGNAPPPGGGVLPDGDLIFAGNTQTSVVIANDYSGIDSITFDMSADGFMIDGDGGGAETLTFNDGASIINNSGQSADIVFGSGLALVFSGSTASITNNDADDSLIFDSTLDISGAGSLALTVAGAGDVTFNGVISGTGSLVLSGSGTIALNAANTFSGGVTLNSGTVALGDADGFGTGAVLVNGDSTIQGVGGAITGIDNGFSIGSGNVLTLSGGENLGFGGTIAGSGSIDVSMATAGDTVSFNGSNSGLLGGVTLTQGTIILGDALGLGIGTLAVEGNDGDAILQTSVADLRINNTIDLSGAMGSAVLDIAGSNDLDLGGVMIGGGRLEVGVDSGTVVTFFGNSIGFTGVVSIDNAGAVIELASNGAFGSGSFELEADGELRSDDDARTLGVDVALGANTLTFGGTNDLTLGGVVSGTGGVTLNATGSRLILGGTNTYTGTTTITDGTLVVTNDDAIGDGGGGANLLINGGGLGTNGADVTLDEAVTLGGDFTVENLQNGSLDLAGTFALGDAARTITTDAGASLTISGVLSSTGQDDGLTKDGSGTLILGGDNNAWGGGVTLAGGSLGVADDNALGSAALTVSGEASLFASGAAITLANDVALGANTLSITGDQDLTLNGDVSGTGDLIVNTSGTVTMAGAGSSFSGGTQLAGGSLVVNDSEALGTGAIELVFGDLSAGAAGVDLDEAVTVTGAVTIGGAEDLTLSGVIDGAGVLTIDFDTAADILTLSGTNTFSGNLSLVEGVLLASGGSAIADTVSIDFSDAAAGTLQIDANETIAGLSGGDATDGVTLGANTLTLAGDGDTAFVFGGVIAGTGGLTVTGGTHYLDGDNTFTGTTSLTGGTLGGDGSVDGDLSVTGGTFDVGSADSTGTFDVAGNFTLGANGTLTIDIGGANLANADQLVVQGTASLASGSTLNVDLEQVANTYVVSGQTFDILTAAGGITDGGIDVVVDSATLQFYLLDGFDIEGGFMDGDTTLSLEAVRAANAFSNPAVVDAGNNRVVGSVLDSLIVVADAAMGQGDAADLLATLQVLNAEDLNTAIEALTPVAAATPSSIATSATSTYANVQAGYLSARRAGTEGLYMAGSGLGDPGRLTRLDSSVSLGMLGSTDPWLIAAATAAQDEDGAGGRLSSGGVGDGLVGRRYRDRNQNLWGKVYAFQSDLDSEGNRTGYDGDFVGGQIGWDTRVGDDFTIGIGFGYLETDARLRPNLGDINADSFRGGPYATWTNGDWFVDASVTYGTTTYKQDRRIAIPGQSVAIARGDFDGTDLTGYLGIGRSYDLGERWSLTPNASIRYSQLEYDGYTETGAGVNNMIISERDQDSMQGRVALTLGRRFEGRRLTVQPELTVGWEHEFEDYSPLTAAFTVGGSPFTVDVGTPVSDAFLAGFGVSVSFEQRFAGYVRWDGLFGGGSDTQGISAGLNIRF